jgi:hypothetical protein
MVALTIIFAVALLAAAQGQDNQLTLTGTLQTGVMAIGAETTGVTITVSNQAYELDIADKDLKKKAEDLSGKQVTVKGTLTIKQGVEVKQRRIITVSSLEAAAAATQAK